MTHLKPGDKAPSFTAKDQKGREINLDDFKGKPVVIYFYPKDNTPGCTTQAVNLKENFDEFKKRGIVILGVSADDEKKHQKFIEKYELPFTLIADVDKEVIKKYGVWGEKKFMGKVYEGIHRTTFVLDKDHTIIDIIKKPKVKDHTREILEIYDRK